MTATDLADGLLQRWLATEPRIRPSRPDSYLEGWLRGLGDPNAEIAGVPPQGRRAFCLSVIAARLLVLEAVDGTADLWCENPQRACHAAIWAIDGADRAADKWRARWKEPA